MSSIQNYMRQNVDFSVNDAHLHNPSLAASDVYRRISTAHTLAGGDLMSLDELSRNMSSSYCALANTQCGNHGGVYMTSNTGCSTVLPMFSRPSIPSVSSSSSSSSLAAVQTHVAGDAQSRYANLETQRQYEMYWRGGARMNIDAVSESRCAIPTAYTSAYAPAPAPASASMSGLASVSSSSASASAMDPACASACRMNGQGDAACAMLCAIQPGMNENAGPFSTDAPDMNIPFDADLPLGVGMNACLRQCVNAPLPSQQQSCRLACVAQTNAPPMLSNASGPCTLECLHACVSATGSVKDCSTRCVRACTGAAPQAAFATPSQTLPLGF